MKADEITISVKVQWEPGATLRAIEEASIIACLALHGGNRKKTAKDLGLPIRTLTHRLRGYRRRGIKVPEPQTGVKKK